MKTDFYKYHGTGNDFVMIDGRDGRFFSAQQIRSLCNRHFGIGSDGLLIIRNDDELDFKMEFFNPDGSEATFCGNGARCIVKFANQLGIVENKCEFVAKDGKHSAEILNDKVSLRMIDIADIKVFDDLIYLNTGTHHTAVFVDDVEAIDINSVAAKIRFDNRFSPLGTNVNFIQAYEDGIKVRTYEKGVEAETLSCGTGVVASALAYCLKNDFSLQEIKVKVKGGNLEVKFEKDNERFINVFLIGPAVLVYSGEIEI